MNIKSGISLLGKLLPDYMSPVYQDINFNPYSNYTPDSYLRGLMFASWMETAYPDRSLHFFFLTPVDKCAKSTF